MKQDISLHKYLFHQGTNNKSYEFLGAHKLGRDGGYVIRAWAPRAVSVALIGDFNGWSLYSHPMHRLEDDDSIWEIQTGDIKAGDLYKFAIYTEHGETVYKADPYAFAGEAGEHVNGSKRCSMVRDLKDGYHWKDKAWVEERAAKNAIVSPMNIYEVNAGSWRRHPDGSFMTYRETADLLIPYVKEMGYTHIELMPITEYPFLGSWGYQVTGYYSVSSRFGTAKDLKYFINKAHMNGIGVIFDWVPAHFPKDECGLINFDGYPLYEDSNPYRMEHKSWGTRAFDFGRPEVLSFLVSNAYFFCEQFHADGLRVDAVAAMLYLNYDRPDGEWSPNDEGGVENKEAIHFLRTVNRVVRESFPGVMMIAEESTAWPHVTGEPGGEGLGFTFKWNMGWMNDTLRYYSQDSVFRGSIHHMLTFSLTYAYSENYILPISHDEVVHGKGSLIGKMPGEYDNKFAQLKSFFTYMMTHPGKKLMFMGSEFAQFAEWNEAKELDWMLLDYDKHRQYRDFVRDLNVFYRDTPAMWERDDTYDGFTWIDADNTKDNVYSYYRSDNRGNIVLVIINNSGLGYDNFGIGVPEEGAYKVVVDSDFSEYGGTGWRFERSYDSIPGQCNGRPQYISLKLQAYSAVVMKLDRGQD